MNHQSAIANTDTLAGKLLAFTRGLRIAGFDIGSRQQIDALEAVRRVGLERADDVRATLCTVLVRQPWQGELFDRAFNRFFLESVPLETAASQPVDEKSITVKRRKSPFSPGFDIGSHSAGHRVASASEQLRARDFAGMNADEQRAAARLLQDELQLPRALPERRYRADDRGRQPDPRRSLRRMLQYGGEVKLAYRDRGRRRPNLVLLCDISGSMSAYTRAFLQYAQLTASRCRHVYGFVFGTRLTNISSELQISNTDLALARIAAVVPDWDGGTRIARSLLQFNTRWASRVLGNNTHVILLSDGLERETVDVSLAFELQRLRRSCRQLLWLNPLLRYDGFRPEAGGMPQLFEQADRLMPAHNIASLVALSQQLASARPARRSRTA